MTGFASVLASVVVVVAALVAVAAYAVVGPERFRAARGSYRRRVRAAAPYLAAVVGVLVVNAALRDVTATVSWIVGWNATGVIYAVERDAVALVQSVASPPLTAYFSFVYVYLYPFLLVFPFVAYLVAPDQGPLRLTAAAFAWNYALGLVCYVFVVAYGPRNVLPGVVDSLLYATYPESQLLTSEVNTSTNVFPSLHTSLSATVALVAWRTREEYPRWLTVSAVGAASVAVSTMYLGIHWLTDVAGGLVLAVVSVRLAARWVYD